MDPELMFPITEPSSVSNCSQDSNSVTAETNSEVVLKTIGTPSSGEISSQTGGCSREPDDTSTDGESESDDVEWEEVTMATGAINGLVGRNLTLTTISVPDRVIVNKDDNETLVATLRERYKLAVKTYLPRINKWIEVRANTEMTIFYIAFSFSYLFFFLPPSLI